ncbi:hypothetical protein MNBD_GAMMA20-1411 [hydrothermal vent metagenome]|uniref:Uncharacterized protein n=1 Tax=hydrothermal vent metagenome TaxID=652676 RepID=A0A3B0ZZX3_9ZZZZ
MELSSEVKEWLTFLLTFGMGIGALGYFILLPILYFRLTRKYDAMFPEYDRIIPLASIMGVVVRTGYYASFILFKNPINGKRHNIMQNVTNGYDFRGNAPWLDIFLSYLYLFLAILCLGSLIVFLFLTKSSWH